jgi:folate-dependent phosphoribosylglycinamide formyltransferase PurN
MKTKVLFLGVDCDTSRMIYHSVKEHWQIQQVIFEEPVSSFTKIKFRLKKLGVITVAGQLLFKLLNDFLIAPFSKKRKKQILEDYELSDDTIPATVIFRVNDLHHLDWKKLLALHQPDVILINGTRILKKYLLDCFSVPVINIHAGITPMYRGVHGGYRALLNDDVVHFGATIHLVDSGVDTGQILKHVYSAPHAKDNFHTYPLLQFSQAIKSLPFVIDNHLKNGTLSEDQNKASFSKLWFYPTIYEYIYYRITKGIK